MKFLILVGGSSRTTGDLIKPKKSSKKTRKKGQKRAQDSPRWPKIAQDDPKMRPKSAILPFLKDLPNEMHTFGHLREPQEGPR